MARLSTLLMMAEYAAQHGLSGVLSALTRDGLVRPDDDLDAGATVRLGLCLVRARGTAADEVRRWLGRMEEALRLDAEEEKGADEAEPDERLRRIVDVVEERHKELLVVPPGLSVLETLTDAGRLSKRRRLEDSRVAPPEPPHHPMDPLPQAVATARQVVQARVAEVERRRLRAPVGSVDVSAQAVMEVVNGDSSDDHADERRRQVSSWHCPEAPGAGIKTRWTEQEERYLLQVAKDHDNQWSIVMERCRGGFHPNRTARVLRDKFHSIMRSKRNRHVRMREEMGYARDARGRDDAANEEEDDDV